MRHFPSASDGTLDSTTRAYAALFLAQRQKLSVRHSSSAHGVPGVETARPHDETESDIRIWLCHSAAMRPATIIIA
jgi:hypothetical protein